MMITIKELGKKLRKGIALSILHAQRHYFIYRLIGENSSALNTKLSDQDHLKRRLSYLQQSGHDGAILNLAKYYEDKSRNQNYCLTRSLEVMFS